MEKSLMSFKSFIVNTFTTLGKLVYTAVTHAQTKGLTDDLLHTALVWVKVMAHKNMESMDNREKREWVVGILVAKGIPESVARLATELAVHLAKAELETIGT